MGVVGCGQGGDSSVSEVTPPTLPATTTTIIITATTNPSLSTTTTTSKITSTTSTTMDCDVPYDGIVSINSGESYVITNEVFVRLSARDNVGVGYYYLSEQNIKPTPEAAGWVSVTSTIEYQDMIPFVLSLGTGTKTVYAWFKDIDGNVSNGFHDSITYEGTKPISVLLRLDGGGDYAIKRNISVAIEASDDSWITGYYLSENPSKPALDSLGWVTASASYLNIYIRFDLTAGDGLKTVYLWVRDRAGNISDDFSQSINLYEWDYADLVSSVNSLFAAIDTNDKFHIGYVDTDYYLKYMTNKDGSWQTSMVYDLYNVGAYSICLDHNNIPYIVFNADDNLLLASPSGEGWQINVIDTNEAGGGNSIAADSNNKLHIAYYDGQNDHLKYATDVSGSWQKETADSRSYVGQCPSLVVDTADKIHILYVDASAFREHPRYAYGSYGSWSIENIDSNDNTGYHNSLAVDLGNCAHAVYYDWSNRNLRYATNTSGSWTPITLGGTYGFYPSIKIDKSNNVHISYMRISEEDLYYVNNDSGTWKEYYLDGLDNKVGADSCLLLDSSDNQHIFYLDSMYKILKYCYKK